MKKLDKKQIPQFAALCVLSAGVFGYFVVKIVTPSPAAAGSRLHPAADAVHPAPPPVPAAPKKAGTVPDAPPVVGEAEAPAPTPGMRDPFMVGYVDPKTQAALPPAPALPAAPSKPLPLVKPGKAGVPVASIREIGPASVGTPALPFGLKGFSAAPAAPALPGAPRTTAPRLTAPSAPAPPSWTVTGVLQNEADQVAILRRGETRRIVRTGDFVDSVYRVMSVTRSAVTLRHGLTFYHLTLGEARTAAPASSKTALPAVTAPGPGLQPSDKPFFKPFFKPFSKPTNQPTAVPEPQDDAQAPTSHGAASGTELAQVIQAALLLAQSYMTPAQAEVDFCLSAFHARRPLPPRVAMRFLDSANAAQPWWQQAASRGELSKTAEAGKRLD